MSEQKPIQIRISAEDKRDFTRLCREHDTTVSRELRRFIREQIKKNEKSDFA